MQWNLADTQTCSILGGGCEVEGEKTEHLKYILNEVYTYEYTPPHVC